MPTPPPSDSNDAVATMVPYKNMPALIGYYLAVFSLIPFVGVPLGIAAVICGFIGLRKAAENPQAKGKVHAWVAIVLGGFTTLAYLGLFATGLLSALSKR